MNRGNNKSVPRIGYQGERGAFSELAALRLHPADAVLVPCPDFASLFVAFTAKDVDLVVLPVENAIAGKVLPVCGWIETHPHKTLTQIDLPIVQSLIVVFGARIDELRTAESHPVALAQCRRFFEEHSHIAPVEANDTAASVRRIMEAGDKHRAAVASEHAAQVYGAQVLIENIADRADNWTRFVLLSHRSTNGRHPQSSGGRP